jgi:hypothetical protein
MQHRALILTRAASGGLFEPPLSFLARGNGGAGDLLTMFVTSGPFGSAM